MGRVHPMVPTYIVPVTWRVRSGAPWGVIVIMGTFIPGWGAVPSP